MSDQLGGTPFTFPAERSDEGAGGSSAGSGAKLDALFNARTRAARTGLQLRDGLAFEEWRRIGAQVGTLVDASAWWIGDWLVFGQRAYPNRYRAAIEATGFSYQTLRNYAWVAAQFPLYRRRDDLSFGHHAEVASLEEQEQEQWLMRAARQRWSRNELRSRLRAGGDESRALAVAIALQIEEERHERWRAAANAHRRSLSDWITDVLDAAAATALP